MEILSRRCRLRDLDIVFGRQQQESLQAGAAMLGTLTFEAVRQQQHQSAEAPPLVLGAGDELVDDDLTDVPEVAELRFPRHQGFWVVERIAVFESQHASFAERAVDDVDAGLIGSQVLQRHVLVVVFRIVQYGVALAEGTAFAILTA